MRVEYLMAPADLRVIPDLARRTEALGFDQFSAVEIGHDPFFPLLLAAQASELVALATAIAIAFPRSPTIMATLAWDLQRFSNGRFRLGLGSQVKGHNVRRFSVPWGPPVPRLREYIGMMRAVWNTWQTGAKPEFRGEHYQFSLMTPANSLGPIDHPNIPIYLAAVGPLMCQLVGEVADGIRLHPFNSPRYTRDTVLPNIEIGLKRSGRTLDAIDLSWDGFIATGPDQATVDRQKEEYRARIGRYASTPPYRGTLEAEGYGELSPRLHKLSLEGKWDEVTRLVSDEMLDAYTISGTYEDLSHVFRERYGGLVNTVHLALPPDILQDEAVAGRLVEEFKKL